MATIAALFDIEEGHLLTSFKYAKALRARAHEVCFLGLASSEPLVCREGFRFVPVLQEFFQGFERVSQSHTNRAWLFGQVVRAGALDEAIRCVEPDLVIVLSLYYAEALAIHARYRLPVVLWTTFCRPPHSSRAKLAEDQLGERLMEADPADVDAALESITAAGYRCHSVNDLTRLVLSMPELIVLPRAVELPEMLGEPNLHYIGTGIDLDRIEEPFPWDEIQADRYLVYCSLGSQCDLQPEVARRFFQAVLGAAESFPDWQFILAVGKGFDPAAIGPPRGNVHVSQWVSQLDVLRRADLIVTHCGPGTVKEAVLLGVPIVALPLMRDQFHMARRIVHHGLGIEGTLADISAGTLASLLGQAAADASLRARVTAMRELFIKEDQGAVGVEVLEQAAASRRHQGS